MRTLRGNLEKVFLEALRLKELVSLKCEEVCFRWIFSDESFQARSMGCEGNGGAGGGKVRLSLWPALIEKETLDRMRDQTAEMSLVPGVMIRLSYEDFLC